MEWCVFVFFFLFLCLFVFLDVIIRKRQSLALMELYTIIDLLYFKRMCDSQAKKKSYKTAVGKNMFCPRLFIIADGHIYFVDASVRVCH